VPITAIDSSAVWAVLVWPIPRLGLRRDDPLCPIPYLFDGCPDIMTGKGSTDQDSDFLREMLSAWPIAVSGTPRQTNAGTNNRSHVVDSPAGPCVLRIYQNTNDLERITYEHALLDRLQHAGLPFATPLPLATDTGDTFVVAANGGVPVVAALFPSIPGHEPQRGGVAEAKACGQALGELDAALAQIAVEKTFPGPPWFGQPGPDDELARNPIEAAGQFPLVPEKRQALRGILSNLVELAPSLYAGLPHQIIHADFYPSNVLMRGNQVSGILDFEFASPGPRAMDVAIGLAAFGISTWRAIKDLRIVEAFVTGYQRRIPLTSVEIEALPDLLRLREATSLVHWIGRHDQGLATEHDILWRVDRLLDLDQWMIENGDNLVGCVAQATR